MLQSPLGEGKKRGIFLEKIWQGRHKIYGKNQNKRKTLFPHKKKLPTKNHAPPPLSSCVRGIEVNWIHISFREEDTWTHGHMDTWTHGHMDTWTHGHMDTWTHGHMDTWTHGHMDTWTHGRVVPSSEFNVASAMFTVSLKAVTVHPIYSTTT